MSRYTELKSRVSPGYKLDEYDSVKKSVRENPGRITLDEGFLDAYQKDVNAYMSDARTSYDSLSYGNAKTTADDFRKRYSDLYKRADQIRTYIKSNQQTQDTQNYHDILGYLDSVDEASGQYLKAFDDANKYYSQWSSLDDYNTYTNEGNAFIGAAINSKDFEEYSKKGASIVNPSGAEAEGYANLFGHRVGATPIGNIVTYSRANAAGIQLGRSQGHDMLGDARYNLMNDTEVNVYNYFLAKEKEGLIPDGYSDRYLKSLNGTLDAREAFNFEASLGLDKDDTSATLKKLGYGVLAGLDQFSQGMYSLVHNDILGEDYTGQSLVQRVSSDVRESLGDVNLKFKGNDVKILGNSVAQVAFDAITTTANMLPTIALSQLTGGTSLAAGTSLKTAGKIGSAVGTTALGASSAGNTYVSLRNEGMDESKARALSLVDGAWQAVSEAFLGGIEGLADNGLSQRIGRAWNNGATKFIMNAVSEGAEEVIQDIGSSVIEGLFTGKYDVPDGEDLAYSFTLGALSAAGLNAFSEGVNSVRNVPTYSEREAAKNIKADTDRLNALKSAGSTYSADSVAYRLAGTLDENTDAYKIAKTLHSMNAELTEQNRQEVANALVEKGVAKKDADTISEWLSRAIDGEELTEKQQTILSAEDDLSDVLRDFIDKNSTYNQRQSNMIKAYTGMDVETGVDLKAVAEDMSRENISKRINEAQKSAVSDNAQFDTMRRSFSPEMSQTNKDIDNAVKATRQGMTIGSRDVLKTITNAKANARQSVSESGTTTLAGTGEDISISRIDSVRNGKMTFELSDGRKVDGAEVRFGSEKDALLYNSLADMGYSASVANAIAESYKANSDADVTDFILGMNEAYNYGKIGYKNIPTSSFAGDLTESQRSFAYSLGREAAEAESAKPSVSAVASGTGRVTFDKSVTSGLKDVQKTSLSTIGRVVADITHNNVVIFESVLNDKGERVLASDINGVKAGTKAPNGMYNSNTGTIYIDLHAGNNGEGTMLYTFAHELIHYMKDRNALGFKRLADFIMSEFSDKDVPLNERILEKQKRSRMELSFDDAYEEVIADAMESMFTDGNVLEKLEKLKNTDRSLWEKIRDFVRDLLDRIKKAYAGLDPQTFEGQFVRSMSDKLEQISDLFAEGIYEAGAADNSQSSSSEVTPESGSVVYSLRENERISQKSIDYYNSHKDSEISEEMFNEANRIVNKMASYMLPYLDITNNDGKRYLPEEILGRTTFSNGSYGRTVGNTTICFRTLAYIDFTNEIKKKIGRPLTVEESFLASQMLYDIAKEPQCLYCYVSLDRKAYDGFLLEYIRQRDDVLNKFAKLKNKSKANIDKLYNEFLDGRKDTKQMKSRFNLWINSAVNGKELIGLKDLATEEVRSSLKNGPMADQVNDAERYAQSASWAKKLEQYRSYNGDILNMTPAMVKKLNDHYGLRFYSFSEYTPAFIVENMQQIRDASLKGLYGLAYTKKTDFARIFAPTGMNINISVFGKMVDGKVEADTRQGADWAEVQALREQYKNVGAVFVATSDELTRWAMDQDWIDIVIPFHIVRTGSNVAEFYKWTNNTAFQADKDASGKNKTISPAEHHNDRATFERLIKERGLTPGFEQFLDNANYMKLVNETRLSDLESTKLMPNFTEETYKAAQKSFDAFVADGGYYGDYYNEGIDYKKAVDVVASDILAGVRANEVTYGRQDINLSDQQKQYDRLRKNPSEKSHGQKNSDRDSEGRSLSEAQQKFFKDSVIRDDNGNLRVMYHGTDSEFYTFDMNKSGKNGTSHGIGYYLTPSKDFAEHYGNRIIEAYVDAKRLMSYDEKTISRAELQKFVTDLVDSDLEEYKSEGLTWQDSFISNVIYTYETGLTKQSAIRQYVNNVYSRNDNDIDVIYEVGNVAGKTTYPESVQRFYDILTKSTGFDGSMDGKELVVFRSNQIKDVSNLNPTDNADIRYSDRSEVELGTLFSGADTFASALDGLIHTQYAAENRPEIVSVYKMNHGGYVYEDVLDIDVDQMPDVQHLHVSPPCVNFSSMNNGKREKPIDKKLATKVAEIITKKRPRALTVENVEGYATSESMNIIRNALRKAGYKSVDIASYKDSDFGGYTNRERVVLRAMRDEKLPAVKEKVGKAKGWGEAVGMDYINALPEAKTVNPRMIESLKTYNGIDPYKVTKPLLVFGESYKNKQFGHAYSDQTLPTIIAESGASRVFMPGGEVKEATPELLAQIMGLDGFKLPEQVVTARRVIGNGIPAAITQNVMGPVIESIKADNEQRVARGEQIRYSLRQTETVTPTSDNWQSGHSEEWFVNNGYPIREDVATEWYNARVKKGWKEGKKSLSEKGFKGVTKREGTQIPSTEKTYAKIYDYLQKTYPGGEWKNLRILDASSGLGMGTRLGLERGFDVTDIEPYVHPDSDYFPDYMDYSSLQSKVESGEVKPFDFIISNAVLNVIPQDTRDNMVSWFRSVLAEGGKLYVNTLDANYTKDASNITAYDSKGNIKGQILTQRGLNGAGNEVFVGSSRSVQKGFSNSELRSYLQDALGRGFKVVAPNFSAGSGATALAIKDSSDERKTTRPDIYQENVLMVKNSERDSNATDSRSLLSRALTSVAQSEKEKRLLESYQESISKMNDEEKRLTAIRKELSQLYSQKGQLDMPRIRELKDEATRTANRINTYDKQLLRLEATQPLKVVVDRERRLASEQAKADVKAAVRAERSKAYQNQSELMKRYRDRLHNNVVGRKQTEVKGKIRKVVSELDRLLNRGTKERNVKIGARDAVSQAINTAMVLFSDMESSDIILNGITTATPEELKLIDKYKDIYEESNKIASQMEAIQEGNDPDMKDLPDRLERNYQSMKDIERKLKDVLTRERSRLMNETVGTAIQSLADAYREIGESKKNYIALSYDPEVYNKLINLKTDLGGTTIDYMTVEQLNEVYDAYKMIAHTIRNANTLFRQNRADSVSDTATAFESEIAANNKVRAERSTLRAGLEDFQWKEFKPVYAFRHMNSKTAMSLYHDFELAEDQWGRDVADAQSFADEVRSRYRFSDWDMQKPIKVKLSSGTYEITLEKLMSIYAYSKREQALEHMIRGGFVLNSKEAFRKVKDGKKSVLKYVSTAPTTMRVSAEDMVKISSEYLTNEQTGYVDEMQKYLTDVMGAKGNEAANILYGIDIFKEKVYFPLQSSADYVASTNQPAGQVSLKNTGMTKETVPKANNPIVLEDFDDVWGRHIGKMSTYHSFVVPIDNFNKVMNYTDFRQSDTSSSVKSVIGSVFGDAGKEYIDRFIQDLNGGTVGDSTRSPLASLIGKFKKTAVAASASVVVQQPTAILRAMSEIDPKYFVPDTSMKHADKWEQLKKYAPVAVIKEIGGFDTGAGRNAQQYLNPNKTRMEKADDILMRGAGYADEIGWNAIWDAAKREVKAKDNLDGEELLKKAGERFSEVVRLTQVYDSTLSRSGYMRSQNDIVKMATAFMGEPTTSYNMMYDAVTQAKRGTMTKGNAVKAVSATVVASVAAGILKSLIGAARKDDDDESYLNKYAKTLASNIMDDLFIPNMLPFVKDVVSIMQGWDVERTDMALVQDLYDAFNGLFKDSKSIYRKIEDFGGAVANVFGIPARNIMRDLRSLYNVIRALGDDTKPDHVLRDFGETVLDNVISTVSLGQADYGTSLNDFLDRGNTERAKEIVKDTITRKVGEGKTEAEAKASIKSSLTSHWKPIFLKAYADGDSAEMARIRKLLNSVGIYDNVVETTQTWIRNSKD